MVTNEERIAFTETLNILRFVEEKYYNKVPEDLIKLFKENSLKYYQYYDRDGQPKMSNLTKEILCYLNLQYWCDEQEKQKLLKRYQENDKSINKKFDSFAKINQRKENNTIVVENSQITIVKENFWKKIINKIKELIKK